MSEPEAKQPDTEKSASEEPVPEDAAEAHAGETTGEAAEEIVEEAAEAPEDGDLEAAEAPAERDPEAEIADLNDKLLRSLA